MKKYGFWLEVTTIIALVAMFALVAIMDSSKYKAENELLKAQNVELTLKLNRMCNE